MSSPPLRRFSSRTHRLDQTVLTEYLHQAKRYHRIAGYFTSSLFEIAGETLAGIEDVRIVCNSDVRSEDIKIAKVQESKLLGRLNSVPVEVESLLNRPRYQRLYDFLGQHPGAIRVAPDDLCGFVHGKAGVIELRNGRRIGFMGSMNETRAGWQAHYEILWQDESPEGVDWIQAEFDALWSAAVPLPRAIVQEIGRRAHRVEVSLTEPEQGAIAPAALVESPMYREGLSLQPWQRAFVAECLKHLRWYGSVRLLLADEVGLGKTLALATAALTLTLLSEQALARQGGRPRRRPIAIFAPAPLTEQWQTELLDKLGLPCARWSSRQKVWLDPDGRAISPVGAEHVMRCPLRIGIISTGLIVQPTRERDLLNQLNFEILIQDESHKSRTRKGIGKTAGEPNSLLQFMLDAAGRSHHVLLGTATPMQTHPEDLWDQLRILHRGRDGRFVLGNDFSPWHHPEEVLPIVTGQDRIDDLELAWRYLRSPLPPLDSSQEPDFRRVIHEIRGELGLKPDAFDTSDAVVNLPRAVQDDLEDLLETDTDNMHFFQRHNPIVRHVVLRKRTVLENAGLLQRVGVELHPNAALSRDPTTFAILFQQRSLRTEGAFFTAYEAARAFGRAYGRRAGAGFMKTLVEQRLCSSCVAGLKTAQQILEHQTIEDDENEQDLDQDVEISIEEQETLHDLIRALEDMQGEDPKLQAVKHYLSAENWLDHGCIIFSQYYDTATWVAENLAGLFPNEPVGLYAGADKSALFRGPDHPNRAKRDDLKHMVEQKTVRIMVATDAACEGLNLQRLGTLINVDLPWNPTRLEQRIGRIKRFGQTRSTVDMLNLVYQDTVDATIYERLSARMKDRFDLFGSLPDTIEDTWIDNIEMLDERLDDHINAQKRMNAFDIRYNTNLDAEEDEWRNCAQVLSQRSIDTLMRNGW